MEYYLTEERLAELKSELEDLKTTKRIEVSERLRKAKELGDLSENAEYSEAREEQEKVEKRIYELEDIVLNAVLIKKGSDRKTVDIGSNVEVVKGDKPMRFFIVGSTETRPEEGRISNESPIGRALIGKKAGDTATVETPDGRKIDYKITKIG